jgi:hypothetical protein
LFKIIIIIFFFEKMSFCKSVEKNENEKLKLAGLHFAKKVMEESGLTESQAADMDKQTRLAQKCIRVAHDFDSSEDEGENDDDLVGGDDRKEQSPADELQKQNELERRDELEKGDELERRDDMQEQKQSKRKSSEEDTALPPLHRLPPLKRQKTDYLEEEKNNNLTNHFAMNVMKKFVSSPVMPNDLLQQELLSLGLPVDAELLKSAMRTSEVLLNT